MYIYKSLTCNFSKLCWSSVWALPGKGLKRTFSLQMSVSQEPTCYELGRPVPGILSHMADFCDQSCFIRNTHFLQKLLYYFLIHLRNSNNQGAWLLTFGTFGPDSNVNFITWPTGVGYLDNKIIRSLLQMKWEMIR